MSSKTMAVIAIGLAWALVVPGASYAIDNTAPSRAPLVSLGVPFAATEENDKPDVWHLDAMVRTGDQVVFAVDNTQGSRDIDVCLFGPTDDYGYDNEVNASCDGLFDDRPGAFGVDAGRADRVAATYSRATGHPFIRVSSLYDRVDNYTITVESIVTRINIGGVPPTEVGRQFSYTASVQYGDNTPAADGTAVALQWRAARRTPGPTEFTTIAQGGSTGGAVVFNVPLPEGADRRIRLRACVDQPGAIPACTGPATVRVHPSASAACLEAEEAVAKLQRRVRKLRQARRSAQGTTARRRLVRRLKSVRGDLKGARLEALERCG